jgi:hypothetical protein
MQEAEEKRQTDTGLHSVQFTEELTELRSWVPEDQVDLCTLGQKQGSIYSVEKIDFIQAGT